MAGNIPPLVSSTPPPLNAFDDDDEEEEEDELGLYNAAEEVDYNECTSFKEKDEEKQNVGKSRAEQDSTSQDSTTDSGLCPDSEGMSPTPHSDDERTLKQNSCDKLCQEPGDEAQSCGNGPVGCEGAASIQLPTVPSPNLPNGHALEDQHGEESDEDFGNFEFAPSQRLQAVEEGGFEKGILESKSLSNLRRNIEENHHGTNIFNIHHNELSKNKIEENEEKSTEFNLSNSSIDGLEVEDRDSICVKEEACKNEQKNSQFDESAYDKLNIASSNDSSSFNSVDVSMEPKSITSSEFQEVEQHDPDNKDDTTNYLEYSSKCTIKNLDYREDKVNEIPVEDGVDDEFDDFTDFKTDFSGCYDFSDHVKPNEHSKTSVVEQTKLEETTSSLPPSHQEESDEEFSNFADFSSSDCAFVSAQSSNSLENVSHIPLKLDDCDLRTESEFQDWVSVFPCEEGETPLVASALLRQDDVVWSRLFPLESSPALSYQWSESLANRRLLTALNIDSRNILFTPWSTSAVPRFAANLSCGPLEPTKATEPLQPPATTPPTTTTTTTTASSTQESVPDAHFDWVGSGLTNPLDYPKTVLNLPKTLSAEAENILSSLPDLLFMRKTYIDFPINEA